MGEADHHGVEQHVTVEEPVGAEEEVQGAPLRNAVRDDVRPRPGLGDLLNRTLSISARTSMWLTESPGRNLTIVNTR